MPIMTDSVPAPDNILKFIRCRSKVSSKNPCATNVCSCRKNELKCYQHVETVEKKPAIILNRL